MRTNRRKGTTREILRLSRGQAIALGFDRVSAFSMAGASLACLCGTLWLARFISNSVHGALGFLGYIAVIVAFFLFFWMLLSWYRLIVLLLDSSLGLYVRYTGPIDCVVETSISDEDGTRITRYYARFAGRKKSINEMLYNRLPRYLISATIDYTPITLTIFSICDSSGAIIYLHEHYTPI